MLFSIKRRALKTHIKTHGAALALLWLPLEAFDAAKPIVAVIIRVDKWNVELFGKTDIFIFADFVFFARMNIGIVKENS